MARFFKHFCALCLLSGIRALECDNRRLYMALIVSLFGPKPFKAVEEKHVHSNHLRLGSLHSVTIEKTSRFTSFLDWNYIKDVATLVIRLCAEFE